MATLGNYEVLEELFRGPIGSVVRARLPGSNHDYVLKIFEPAMMGLLEADSSTQTFLDRTALQKLLAARGAKYWAPIHEIHGTADGAYYVTDHYPLTAQKLADRKAPVDGKALHALISSVVKGLLELRTRNRRAHGNLKPSNVLVSGDEKDLASAKVALSDPATEGDGDAPRAADIASLGNLIHQLVLHRPFTPASLRAESTPWPVPASPEWAALGRRGDGWRDLCNRLLSPDAAARPQSLEAVVDLLRDLTPGMELPALPKVHLPKVHLPKVSLPRIRPPKFKVPVRGLARVAAVVAVLAALGGVAAVVLSHLNQTARSELAAVNGQWFGPFERGLRDPDRRAAYRAEPGLKPIVEELERAEAEGIRLDGAVQDSPYSITGYRKTRAALAAVERIRQQLAPDRWPGLSETISLQRRYESRHWDQPSGFLGELVRGTQPAPGNDVAAGVDRYLRVRSKTMSGAEDVETAWKQLEADLRVIEGTGDRVLVGFAAYFRNSAAASVRFGEDGVDGLGDLIWNDLPLAARVAAVVNGGWPQEYGRERFARDVESTLNTVQPKGEDIRVWLDNVGNYALVPLGDEFPAVASLRAGLQKLADDVARQPVPSAERAQFDPAKFAAVRAELEAKIVALRDTRFVKKDLTSPNQGDIAARRIALQKEFDSLRKQWVTLENPREWVASIEPDLPTESVRLKERWAAWLDALKTRADVLSADQKAFNATKKATEELKAALTNLDTTFPSVPLGLSPRFPAFASAAYNKREQELDALTAWAAPTPASSGTLPVVPDPATIQPAAERYAKWAGKLKDLTRDFPINKELLSPEDRPDEKWAKDADFWNDPIVQGLVKVDVDRIGNLAKVSGTGRTGLVALAAASEVPEVALAAWRRLGGPNAAWPTKKGELEKEQELRVRIANVIAAIKDPAARAAWAAELKAQGPERWVRFANVAAGPEWLGEASSLRDAFGVSVQEVAMLYPPARFNLAVYEARAAAGAANPAQADVRAAVDELRSAAAGPSKDRTDVADLLAKLDRLDRAEPMAAALGAGQAPKEFKLPVKGSAYVVQFVRVEPQGVRPYYLATTEVSLGLFVDLVNAAGTWPEANAMLGNGRPQAPQVPQYGPQAWARPNTQEAPIAPFTTATWHFNGGGGEFEFPPSLYRQRFNRSSLSAAAGGDPTLDHPMQQVPARAALYAAGLLNCRLPTSREWREVYTLYETRTGEDGWNLRDDTWRVQQEFTAFLRTRTDNPKSQWPDGGNGLAGVFAPADASGRQPSTRARSTKDGTLFFRPVDGPGGETFKHLVGNVAEFVCDAPDAFDARADRRPIDGVVAFLKSTGDKVSVIGGSALSPVELTINQAYPVAAPGEPYADVGFRLAFTAPAANVAERLRWVLADQAYLPVNPVAGR